MSSGTQDPGGEPLDSAGAVPGAAQTAAEARGLAEALSGAVDTGRLWRDVETLAQWDRHSGGQGEREAVDYVTQELLAAGIEVAVYEFESLISLPGPARLDVLSPAAWAVPCKTHAFAAATGPAGLEVDARWADQAPGRVAGQALIFDGLVNPHRVLEAQERGAAAAVFVNPDRYLHEMIVTTVWGTPTLEDRQRLPRIPVVSIARDDGARLREAAAQGPLRLRLVTEVDTRWRRLPLPVGYLPGAGPDFIVVGAHIDSWHLGVTDNATGDAAVLELARVLAASPKRLRRGFWFCWWPGHSTGRYSGSTWFADTFHRVLRRHAVLYYNIDSPGVRGADHYVARHTSGEFEVFSRGVIEAVTGRPVACQRPTRVADQSFLNMGLPSLAAYSFLPPQHPDRRAYAGGSAGAWWWHHEEDTLDKADPQVLARDTQIAVRILAELAARPRLPFSFSRVADDLDEAVAALRQAAGSHWEFTTLAQGVARLRSAAARFDALAKEDVAGSAAAEAAANAYNQAGMRLSRILNPAVYRLLGPHAQDPASRLIALEGLDNPALPALRAVADLHRLDGDEARFLQAQLLREQNRILAALDDAVELMEQTVRGADVP